jgi:hypothetical protein
VSASHAPSLRARWPQRILGWWAEHAPDQHAAATARVPARIVTAIEEAPETEWIDIGLHIDCIEALRDVAGAPAFLRAYVDASEHALALPVFESMLRPLVRLAGRRALVHGFARGWGMFVRACGYVDVFQREGAREATIRYSQVPRMVVRREAYRESLASLLEAMMRRGGFPGRVELDDSRASAGELHYRLVEDP